MSRQKQVVGRLGRTRCLRCRGWILPKERDPNGSKRCLLCRSEHALGMHYPGQMGHMWMVWAHLLALMKEADRSLHRTGCRLGRRVTPGEVPEGEGHTRRRHGCTCGFTGLAEAIESPFTDPEALQKRNEVRR